LLLAAGAGVRAGGPKALRRFEDGVSWLERSAATLRDGGCDPVVVVVGASAAEASALVPGWARTVVAEGWAEGMGASLRAGLRALLDDAGHPVSDVTRTEPFVGPTSLVAVPTSPVAAPTSPVAAPTSPVAVPTSLVAVRNTPVAVPIGPVAVPTGPVAALIGLVDTPGVTPAVVDRLLQRATSSVLARAAYRGEPGHPVLIGRDHWAAVAATARGDAGARAYLAAQEASTVECADLGSGEDQDTPSPGLT
jgi:CTP:molybdopterin cytidylyltransferase MocA